MITNNKIFTYSSILMAFALMSFGKKQDNTLTISGKYGVCNCDEQNAVQIELILNEDLTFHYFNNTDPNHLIDQSGNWTSDGSNIQLTNYGSEELKNDKWAIDKNEKCLKSRSGLMWTRLCNIKACSDL